MTVEHPVADGLDRYIPSPGVPRANRAPSKEMPEGSPNTAKDKTVLQSHVDFWDRDRDGIIFPGDTYVGFRRIGFNPLISALAVPFIHGSFSYATSSSWIPDLRFPLHIKNMHRAKHGSDTETFDNEGRFVPQKFEEIFTKYDKENKGGLSWDDIEEMCQSNRNIGDPVGWTAERLEWWATHILLKDEQGLLTKERIRAQYDGTLWGILAEEQERKRQGRKWEWEVFGHPTFPKVVESLPPGKE